MKLFTSILVAIVATVSQTEKINAIQLESQVDSEVLAFEQLEFELVQQEKMLEQWFWDLEKAKKKAEEVRKWMEAERRKAETRNKRFFTAFKNGNLQNMLNEAQNSI